MLHLLLHDGELTRLGDYCRLASEACGIPLENCYPIVGRDAFRTGTGVHASAIIKAEAKGDTWLADRVYSGIPAAMVGRVQEIEIGPMSGEHNVRFYLQQRGIDAHPVYVEKILAAAKRSNTLLSEQDVLRMVKVMEARLKAGEAIEAADFD